MNRRDFLRYSASSFLGVTFSNQVKANYLATTPAKNVIFLYMAGGMSHIDTFDPKHGHENQGPCPIANTNVDGITISGYLPRLAQIADKYVLIRSLSSKTGVHEQGNYVMHTGYDKNQSIAHPSIGAWITNLDGKFSRNVPNSIIIGSPNQNTGAGFLEPQHAPLVINNYKVGLPNSILKNQTPEEVDKKIKAIQQIDGTFINKYGKVNRNVSGYKTAYDDAVRTFGCKELDAFKLENESESIRESYGQNNFGQGCLLARRLVENGVRFVEVISGGWDTHNNNFDALQNKGKELDDALFSLLTDLDSRGLLSETLVVVSTEFGRTPKINTNNGRDHYPKAFSGLIAGGGIKGGVVVGKTDPSGSEVIEREVSPQDLFSTIGFALNLPIQKEVYSKTGRPFTFANEGTPLTDLFL